MDLIVKREKANEFRNIIPKKKISHLWIYESSPTMELKYIVEVSEPIMFPDKIDVVGYGDDRFNQGEMNYKYCYKILHLYELNEFLSINFLRSKFSFYAPQSFTYLSKYEGLKNYVENKIGYTKIF
jgi:hypothetical protein